MLPASPRASACPESAPPAAGGAPPTSSRPVHVKMAALTSSEVDTLYSGRGSKFPALPFPAGKDGAVGAPPPRRGPSSVPRTKPAGKQLRASPHCAGSQGFAGFPPTHPLFKNKFWEPARCLASLS